MGQATSPARRSRGGGLSFRLNSLKARTALAMASVIVAMLLANALFLIVTARRDLRRDVETKARLFASLTTRPICVSYEVYYASGFFKFRGLMREFLRLSEDVDKIRIVDVEGRVLFDSSELDEGEDATGAEKRIEDADHLVAVQSLEPTLIRPRKSGEDETFEIVSPFLEDWGRHRFSVSYDFSYRNLRPRIVGQIYTSVGLALLSVVLCLALGVALMNRITRPLEELTASAKGLAEGRFDRRLDIRSPDEIQVLADAFNYMTHRLDHIIDQLESTNRRLAAANQELEAKNAELERFTYSVSHDLKSPLITIRAYLGFLEKDARAGNFDRLRADASRIADAAMRMHRLLDDVLELSRIGRVIKPSEEVSLAELAEEAVEMVQGRLGGNGVRVTIAPHLPRLWGDRARLVEVLQNLLDNASKFMGGQAQPQVEIGARTTDGPPVVFVRDNGIGIEPQYHEKVFGLFEKLNSESEGTGLGLALVRRIVEVHGGRIWVESKGLGQGSTFCFTLAGR